MKFTDGYWQVLPGVQILRPRFVESVADGGDHLMVYAATAPLSARGDTLNRPMITVRLDSPAEGIIGVRIEHFQGVRDRGPRFELNRAQAPVQVHIGDDVASLTSGSLTARVRTEGSWQVEFVDETGRVLTSSIDRSVGIVSVADDGPYVCEQLTLGVAERRSEERRVGKEWGRGGRRTLQQKTRRIVD